jgi:hypothetical protein
MLATRRYRRHMEIMSGRDVEHSDEGVSAKRINRHFSHGYFMEFQVGWPA